jgi:OFA family oxalate/formate antiporter-like MFS transporter
LRENENVKRTLNLRFLATAISINAVLGVLYAWSLFLVPLELLLNESRASVSVVPTVALVCFTIGMFFHDHLLRRLPLAPLTAGVLALAGLGHLLFWWSPSYVTLLVGYGLLFGFGGGIGFGLALALARSTTTEPRGSIVGLVAATFAASGMSVSALGATLGTVEPVPHSFGLLAAAFLTVSLLAGVLLRGQKFPYRAEQVITDIGRATRNTGFWLLFIGNFTICYAGLMFVSHGAALLHNHGLAIAQASWAPFSSNVGYLIGALFGGVIATRFPGRATPLVFSLLSLLSTLTFLAPEFVELQLLGLFFIGSAFGGTVSVFMMLFTVWFGADKVGALFARLNVGYGVAGLLAPAFTGWLFTVQGSYEAPVLTCIGLLLVGCAAIAFSTRPALS